MTDYLRIDDAGGLILSPDWAGIASLHGKIAAVMGALGSLAKDGTNTYFKFKYTSYNEMAVAVRQACAQAGLALTLSMDKEIYEEAPAEGSKEAYYRVFLHITLADSTSGAMKVVTWVGEATDSGDKGINKAITNGFKYALMRGFLCNSTEDDAEPDAEKGTRTSKPKEAPKPQQSTKLPKDWEDAVTAWRDSGFSDTQILSELGVSRLSQYEPGAAGAMKVLGIIRYGYGLNLSLPDIRDALGVTVAAQYGGDSSDAAALLEDFKGA